MTYYSQAGEDQYIQERLLSIVSPKSRNYIEIGALDGVKYSNTKYLEESLGWSGILIEPNPVSFDRLKLNRPQNTLVSSLISNQRNELEYSYYENENMAAVSGATSTLTDKNKAVFYENKDDWYQKCREKYLRKTLLKPTTLDSVIEASSIKEFGFCSIDVEGHELQVLQSFSFNVDVSILLIEKNPNDNEIAELLKAKHYIYFDSVSHNDVYLSRDYYENLQARKLTNVA